MNADAEAGNPTQAQDQPQQWYQPQPGEMPEPEWPLSGPLYSEELAIYPAAWAQADGKAPTLYRTGSLAAPAGAINDGVLGELNAALAPHCFLARGSDQHGEDDTFDINMINALPDAWLTLNQLRDLRHSAGSTLSPAASAAIDGLALRRLHFVGLPAKDGHAGSVREAVTVFTQPPARSAPSHVPGGRRPVVAVIDSGVGQHPWFGDSGDDPFWTDARTDRWLGGPTPPTTDQGSGDLSPMNGNLDSHAGHGTFITGLIRQLAPDARVLSMYAMTGDGVLDETVVLDALDWLLKRVKGAADPAHPKAADFVDVLNLSFGYYEQQPADNRYTVRLRQLLGDLGSLGVQVVASAGNRGTTDPVFPAALADQNYTVRPEVPLISVGALNPDGSHAKYSNYGDWVQVWAPGTAVVSTAPPFDPPFGPTPGSEPAILDYNPDDLVGGFAQWGGTSFAAGTVSGWLARALSDGAIDGSLTDVSPSAACARAKQAYQAAKAKHFASGQP
jgi:hypothetical protein